MTAKKTAAKPAANPFEEEDEPKGQTLPETTEDKADSTLPVDDTKDSEPSSEPKVEPAAPVENPDKDEKPKRKRRTKAEIEADKAKTSGEGETAEVDFTQVDHERWPLSAVSGQVVATVGLNNGAVPILSIATLGWIGEPPVVLAASQIGDVEEVLRELKKQAKDAVRK